MQSGKNECLAQLSLIPGIVLNLDNFKMNWSVEFWSVMPVTVSVTLWSHFFFCRNASTSWVRNSTWATRTSWRPRSWPCQLSTNIRTRWLPSGLLLSIRVARYSFQWPSDPTPNVSKSSMSRPQLIKCLLSGLTNLIYLCRFEAISPKSFQGSISCVWLSVFWG